MQQRPASAARASAPDPAFLKQYRLSCHSDRVKAGALSLEALDVASVGGHADVWEKVVRKLRTGMMPPDGVPKPVPRSPLGVRGGARGVAGSRGGRAAGSRDAGAPSLEPGGVCERHPGSPGARCGRGGAAAAGRLRRRLRQHRRRARRVAGAHRRVCGRGGADQPAGDWQSDDRPRSHDLPDAGRRVAGGARGRAAVGHARRPRHPPHVPARRRVRPAGGAGRRRPAGRTCTGGAAEPTIST